ncbi:hypothetical protein AB0I16_17280 [Streptomyces sp. NPDC050703]|uniref:hypothetical protein n=1 Tax=Streptomyces sp. NPDC050703 TaxID=3157218 RepID=UPI0034334C7F
MTTRVPAQRAVRSRTGRRYPGVVAASALFLALSAGACQGPTDRSDDDSRPASSAIRWREVPRTRLPGAFHDLAPVRVTATAKEFLVLGRTEHGSLSLYGSKDGRRWYPSSQSGGQIADIAAVAGGVTAAGRATNDGTTVPAVWTSTTPKHWGKPQYPAGGGPSDTVLGVARGDRGTVVVTHDGGPFGESVTDDGSFRGTSLRLWSAPPGGRFGQPHEVTCPSRMSSQPQATVLADRHGFVVAARCTDSAFRSKRVLLTSKDGARWQNEPRAFRGQVVGTGTSDGRASVLVTHPESSSEHPGRYVSTLWHRKDSAEWTPGRPLDVGRLPDLGVAPRHDQSVNALAAVRGGYLAAGRSLDPRADGPVGALWTSKDGAKWSKAPTKKNHFDAVEDLLGAAELDGTLILLAEAPPPTDTESGSDEESTASPPPAVQLWQGRYGSAPAVVKSTGPEVFTGTWSWGHGSLTVDEVGRFTYRWRLFNDCETSPQPCDSAERWGGKATGTLKPTPDGRELRGLITAINTPADGQLRKGARVKVALRPYDAVAVAVGKTEHGLFCGDGPGDSRCRAVHG